VPLYGARVEYALHSLLNLSLAPAGTHPSARDLAEFQKLPVPFMRKLLTQLEGAGLVEGSEGIGGGWRLRRSPSAITVLEVADAAGGDAEMFECREIRARCILWPDDAPPKGATTGVCTIHAVMLSAEAAMRRELAGHTLAEIADRVAAKSPRTTATSIPDWFARRYAERRQGTAQPLEPEGRR
jgi:Rrf2 family protein